MHPIERLRYVARSSGADQRVLVRETAAALRGLRIDPAGVVIACRRIVERHPTSGPLWWLCSSLMTATDPFEAAARLADHLEDDPTPDQLVRLLPDEALVCVVGWPDLVGEALLRRGDLSVLVVDADGQGAGLARQLDRADVEVVEVPAGGAGAAAAAADLVLVEALATGSSEALCGIGSRAAAATAYCSEVPVWMVVGRGRRLPDPTWATLLERVLDRAEPWDLDVEPTPIGLASHLVDANGLVELSAGALAGLLAPECPLTPELLKPSPF